MHDIVTIGIPVLAILVGILFNRTDFNRLETRMQTRFDTLQAEINTLRNQMHGEFREFYRTLGQHDARLDSLERDGK